MSPHLIFLVCKRQAQNNKSDSTRMTKKKDKVSVTYTCTYLLAHALQA